MPCLRGLTFPHPFSFFCFWLSVDIDYERFEKRVIAKPDSAKTLIRASLAENFIFSSLSEEEKEDFVNAMEQRFFSSLFLV